MKRISCFLLGCALLLTSAGAISFNFNTLSGTGITEANALNIPSGPTTLSSLPTTIDLNDNTDSEIRSYYSSLDNKSTSERQGTNLLKNLKDILKNSYYFSYATVWDTSRITERNWDKSPVTSITSSVGTYNSGTNTIANYSYSNDVPYVNLLYRNDNDTNDVTINSTHGSIIDREHCWPQSRGFKAQNGASGPAGTDIHHLILADSSVNQQFHNNYAYGNVTSGQEYKQADASKSYLSGNVNGYNTSVSSSQYVFEPQDCDKGDIARACFYMCARYNNYAGASGAITDYEPFLVLNDTLDTDTVSSTDSTPASYGMLSALLEWHRADPVDDYEIHRNNLIYNNFQLNRNPFIDFPEWVEYIWGNEQSSYATPATDTIGGSSTPVVDTPTVSLSSNSLSFDSLNAQKTSQATATNYSSDVTWSISSDDSSIATASINSSGLATITSVSNGSTTVRVTGTNGSETDTKTISVSVNYTPPTPAGDDVAYLVTDVNQIESGDRVIIAAGDYNVAMSTTQNTNNRGQTIITKDGDALDYDSTVQILTVEEGVSSNTFALNTNGSYICAASSSSNYLRTETTKTANSSWQITISGGVATITATGTYTRNTIRYNLSSTLFSCYDADNSMKDVALYEIPQTSSPSVSLSPSSLSFSTLVGTKTSQATASNFSDETNISWTVNSSNGEVATATVSSSGLITVTQLTSGNTDITVTATSGTESASSILSVTVVVTPVVSVSSNSITFTNTNTQTSQATAVDFSGSVTWTVISSNNDIATASIDSNGLVTINPVSNGETTITVTGTYGNQTDDAIIGVTVSIQTEKTLVTKAYDNKVTTSANITDGEYLFYTPAAGSTDANPVPYNIIPTSRTEGATSTISPSVLSDYSYESLDTNYLSNYFVLTNTAASGSTPSYTIGVGETGKYLCGNDSGTGITYSSTVMSNGSFSLSASAKCYGTNNTNGLLFASASTRIILFQAGTTNKFGHYASTNAGGTNYSCLFAYKMDYAYNLLINELETADCAKMTSDDFKTRISYLYNKMTSSERSYLSSETITCNDGNTYTASYAYNYSYNYSSPSSSANNFASFESQVTITIVMISVVSSISVGAFAFFYKKKKYTN